MLNDVEIKRLDKIEATINSEGNVSVLDVKFLLNTVARLQREKAANKKVDDTFAKFYEKGTGTLTTEDIKSAPADHLEPFKGLSNMKVVPGQWGSAGSTNIKSDGTSADYYKLPEGAKELQDLIAYKNMNAQIGEVFRECYRYGQASHCDKLRGINKIIFYSTEEKKRLQKYELNTPIKQAAERTKDE